MSKCARKLAPRWGALITFGYLLILGLARMLQDRMPATNTVQGTYGSGTFELPYALPRLADVVVVFIATTIAVWLVIDFGRVELAPPLGFDDQSDLWMSILCAAVLGVLGAGVAVFGGLWWVFGGAVLMAVLFMACYLVNRNYKANGSNEWQKNMNRGLVMVHLWGGLVMFFIATPFTGLMPAATYALITLAVITSIELVIAGVVGGGILLFRIFKNPFKQTFLACELGESCEETAIVQT